MNEVQISYDDINLSEIIHIKEIRRDIGNPRDIQTNNSIFLGESFERVINRGKTIQVEFAIWGKNKNETKHKLAGIFYTKEPKRLVFSDEPDKYYMALISGEIQIVETQGRWSEGSMTFFVPDGVAHSYTYKEVTSHRVESDRIIYTVENNGTVDAFPIIEVEHEEENGYLAFVNREGISAFGNEAADDAANWVRPSEPLLDFKSGRLFNSVSLPTSVYGGGSSAGSGAKSTYQSNNDRGYIFNISVEVVSQNTSSRTNQIRVRGYLTNKGWTFALYDIRASVTIAGQTFSYSGRPPMLQNNSRLDLIDKTIAVSGDSVSVSGVLNGGGGWSPNELRVRGQTFRLPRMATSSSQPGYTQATGPNLAQKNVATKTNDFSGVPTGSLRIENAWGRNHIALNSIGSTGQNQSASSASLTWALQGSERTTSEYLWWRQIFWCGKTNQQGWIKVIVTDDQNNFLYGVETIKRGDDFKTEYNFFATDNKGGFEFHKRWTFEPDHKNEHNPFNKDRGWSDLERKDDQVDVYWFGSKFRVTVPNIKGKKAGKVHVIWAGFEGKEWPTHMYLDELYFRMDFGNKFNQKPTNAFGQQSEVVINSEDDTVQLDGVMNANLLVDGAGFIRIPPGESELQFYASSWTKKMPRVKIRFRERWL
ncbi:phage tail family protein [Streptococcus sp. 121]|uniref:distal tail protein Dit n=1 Tax=Streptococcus sp. 121 TaxID=2797637 RepID=UPI0018F063A5|nr:distal tail protein Dit [Streptococcus sp. 121]MBJ6745201.1 phage tail family protein [Streptococcus sp. 121]